MRFRSDRHDAQTDGAKLWYADWMGGPTLARIENCRIESMAGDMRRTVTITGHADTFFSIPALCSIGGVKVCGYVTGDDNGCLVFRHTLGG
ncbi:hypothetical protein [Bradyrhizobium retamae]|uniref:Uncharacterized protein n=1 Tax=Bradyrhizobium retamae TaxID=1300035 RepID=A0A0R3MXV4_9BRAD|nr:hypothetical protein [Bradyrhizobium retamae]KRR22150.1 hypothetical protein CQ13_29925 [Bradyrhizobium retamae]